VIHFALYRRSDPDSRASNGFGNIGSEEPLIVVGTGSAVSPFNFCLSAQGNQQDRSDDHATLDGLKRFRLSRARFNDRARFGRSLPGVRQVRVTRTLRPVSQATGVSAVPHT